METVDYGDTSEEDTTDQPTIKHDLPSLPTPTNEESSNCKPKPKPKPKPRSQSDIINQNLDNLASLIPILQSHQQLIEAESNSILQNKKPPKHSTKKSSKKHVINSNTNTNTNPNPLIPSTIPSLPTPITSSLDNPESIAYFILRSNNEENVRTSMEKGVWATQPQNEPILNEAFEKFEKVILFFSVCRSMHFQGLAQMTSRIGHHKSRSLWETDPHTRTRGKSKWGGTFTVRWYRIFDLAFDQTNNICNPWNGNRPVKFSRDGQAAPFHVGQQITHLFDIGVMEFGQGSAILRKPIRIGDPQYNIIAVQKVFVNGRFIPATDIQTAQNMITLEQQQQTIEHNNNNNNNNNNVMHVNNNNNINNNNNNNNEAANALNRLVNSLQKQTDTNVIGNININNANSLLNIANLLSNDLNVNKKINKHKRDRDRNKKRDRDRGRDRHRHRSGDRDRERSRDRHRHRDRDRGRDRNRDRDRDRKDRNKKNNKYKRDNGNDNKKRRSEQEVINSLWTQINLQQALLAQSGLYNALNVNGDVDTNNITTTAPPPTYPSNRGGVY